FRMLLPRAYGGGGGGLVTWFRAVEGLAKLDGSTPWWGGQINGCAAPSGALGPAGGGQSLGGARPARRWGPPNKSRADEIDGGHRLNGEWGFSSGSRHATWIGLMAPVFDRKGAPVPVPGGTAFRIFLVPAASVEWIDNWDVVGLNATNSGGFK